MKYKLRIVFKNGVVIDSDVTDDYNVDSRGSHLSKIRCPAPADWDQELLWADLDQIAAIVAIRQKPGATPEATEMVSRGGYAAQ